MKFVRRTADREPSVNLTPLIDIVFLLLIFFMVSSRFIDEHDLPLELPGASTAERVADENPLVLAVTSRGNYRLAGQRLTESELVASLEALKAQYPERALRLRADGRARHASVVAALDAAAVSGFARVEIATRGEQGG